MTNEISAKVIEDSISEENVRLTTFQLRFPRFILAEFNTHRQFSRNFRSTRAVPTTKLIKEIRDNPFVPIKWLKNKPGMQAVEPMEPDEAAEAERVWREAASSACDFAEKLFALGLHKQWSGRVIEPYMYVDGVVSSVHWTNFDTLRDHSDAQPEIEYLAKAIIEARNNNTPKLLKRGEWHLPYVTLDEREEYSKMSFASPNDKGLYLLKQLSVARCARVSYSPFDGNASPEKEFERYQNLVGSTPIHASPAEHQATPDRFVPVGGSIHWPVMGGKHQNYMEILQDFVKTVNFSLTNISQILGKVFPKLLQFEIFNLTYPSFFWIHRILLSR